MIPIVNSIGFISFPLLHLSKNLLLLAEKILIGYEDKTSKRPWFAVVLKKAPEDEAQRILQRAAREGAVLR